MRRFLIIVSLIAAGPQAFAKEDTNKTAAEALNGANEEAQLKPTPGFDVGIGMGGGDALFCDNYPDRCVNGKPNEDIVIDDPPTAPPHDGDYAEPAPYPTYPGWEPPRGGFKPIEDAIAREEYENALEEIRRLQEKYPDSPTAHKYAAMVYSRRGDVDGAMAEINAGLKVAPGDDGLRSLAKLVLPRVGAPVDDKALKNQAKALAGNQPPPGDLPDKGRKPEGGSWLESAIQRGGIPQAMRATLSKRAPTGPGVAKLQVGDFSGAEKNFSYVIEREPGNWLAFRLRAMTRHKMKNYTGAIADATQALKLNPGDGWSYKARAKALIDSKRYDEAMRDLDAALALDKRDSDAYATRALLWDRLGKVEEKLADFERAAYVDPAFKDIFREEFARHKAVESGGEKQASGNRRLLLYGGAAAVCLLFLGMALFRRSGATLTTAPAAETDAVMESVVGYDILGQLGQGGMGEVYEAMDRALQRKVAIKKMHDEIAGNPRERKRFLKEARTVAGLKHPNIIEIFSVLEEEGGLYLVFELMAGETLGALNANKGTLSLGEALPYIRQIAQALDYAHAQGVIHQDLKPANVMVANGTAKVMDFGIARRAQDTLSTRSRMEVSGTPCYMAPEQEEAKVVPQSDVFALGVCAYELLSGQLPYHGMACHPLKMQKAYVPLSRLVLGASKELDAVIDKALEPAPEKRFQTAGQFVSALEKLAA